MFLTVDGGGSKINAILYDENMNVLRRARSGGINLVQNTPESCRQHFCECLDGVLEGVSELDSVEAVIAGDRSMFDEELKKRVRIGSLEYLSEPVAGLMAASCMDTGFLALSGTGSDVFYIKEGKLTAAVGGWGPVLGDQGSGVWIGLQAIRTVSKAHNGWEQKTLLLDMVEQYFQDKYGKRMIEAVLQSQAPYSVAAQLVPVVGKAAREGDELAQQIFRNAGLAMGKQMEVVMHRMSDVEDKSVYLCGGAWKAYEEQKTVCEQYLKDHVDPSVRLIRPIFEHVVAGPVKQMIALNVPKQEIRSRLMAAFDKEVINREVF